MGIELKWVENHVEMTPPRHPKKLTATRFASVLGLNPWSSDFEVWCAVTRAYEKPFEDTIYTAAGKTIEPKQIAYMKDNYMMDNLRTPTDIYGPDYFHKTYGDFFPQEKVLGGMWDSLLVDEKGKPCTVLEFKTTKRVEDWADDIPEYYALQAALYAYLLGVDDVIMVCSILAPKDYEHPDKFVPSVSNTITRPFKVSERYPNFKAYVNVALEWWKTYVKTGVSPNWDERKDSEILHAMRSTTVDVDGDLGSLVTEAETLKAELDAHTAEVAEKSKRLKTLTEQINKIARTQFKDGDTEVQIPGSKYIWKMTRKESMKLDEAKMKEDGVYAKYCVPDVSYRMTVSVKKEDK